MPSIKERVRAADDRKREKVDVPEWGNVTIWIRSLSGKELDDFQLNNTIRTGKNRGKLKANVRARALILAAEEEDGSRAFSDEDLVWLGQKSGAALDRCFDVFRRLNRMGEDLEAEEEKNSETTAGSASTTG